MEKKEKFEQVQNIIVLEVNLVKTNAESNSCGCIIGPFFVVKLCL